MILEIHNFTQNDINEGFFKKIFIKTGKFLRLMENSEISLAMVGDGRMRGLNKMYRGKNRTTDVLSFSNKPVLPYLSRAFPKTGKNKEISFVVPSDGIDRLGEIIISYPQAKKNARRLGIPLERELTHLFIHGLLHLAGYDHAKEKEAEEMRQMENRILEINI